MDKVILLFCSFISCIIIVNILFQFLNDRYLKTYQGKWIYIALSAASILVIMLINMFMDPILNLTVHILLFGLISYFFYYETNTKKAIQILEIEGLYIIVAISESLGVFLIQVLLNIIKITPESLEIQQSVETTFSKIVLLFLYYVIFSRIWKKNVLRTKTQYVLYFIMFTYSVVNILALIAISNTEAPIVLMMLVGCIIFSNMYLLYFIKFTDERNYYKRQIEMMEQQQKIQFDNYRIQKEKYEDAMIILHDVNKHIKAIEGLFKDGSKDKAAGYTKKIKDRLQPLAPFQFTDNLVLNCLLTDKTKEAEKLGILFQIKAAADINFMEPIDITTLFGNLIDNAIAAGRKSQGKKYIGLFIGSYNEMISIRVENSVWESILIKNGKIINKKGIQSGIGLLNIQRCINEYEGSIIYQYTEELLICDIMLNRTDV